MENTKIGISEAIAFLIIIFVNFAVLDGAKSTLMVTSSSAIINVLYVNIISLIISYLLYKLLNKFPTFDILDISKFLGGNFLKFLVGFIFLLYFIFLSASLLKNFAFSLQTIYYPFTNTFFIILLFLFTSVFVCNLKYNALFRSNLIILPLIILSILLLFFGNMKNFSFNNVFPVLGNGVKSTFISGLTNIFTFQSLAYLLFLPPYLKDITKLKKITLISMLISGFYFLISVASLLLLFYGYVSNESLMPLFSAVRYIEFGAFFQRLDSIFLMVWIISFISYLSITLNICSNIVRKTTSLHKNKKISTIIIATLMFVITSIIKNHAISSFLIENVCNYIFFIIMGISFIILLIASCYKSFKTKFRTIRIN